MSAHRHRISYLASRKTRGHALLAAAVGVGCLVVLTASAVYANAAAVTIAVDDAQNVTISGSSESLRATIEEVCARAGVELRAFEAEDRPFAAEYGRVPLSEALTRLLRTEVFIAGMRPDPRGGRARVAWLRVGGSQGAAFAPARTAVPPAASVRAASGFDFGPNPRLAETALTSKDPTARGRARQVVLDGLREDPSPLQRFVQRDPEQVVEELVDYPHAAEFLRDLQTVTLDPTERSQLQAILGQVQVRQAAN